MIDREQVADVFATLVAEGDGVLVPPFRWQVRLLCRLMNGDIPQLVDIPTGLGKTSVMALWLIALAEGAELPRRLVYVVDRRAVVDQATRFAERLKANLPEALANALGVDSASGGLAISTLRGGFADNRDWLADPSKPAIIVGTVDMIGSRLLFEGYGVSRRMRPYHAGLLGVDALVLLDEAHLCPPFETLLQQVMAHRAGDSAHLEGNPKWPMPPFRLMSLSATGHDTGKASSTNVFRLDQADREEAEVRRRLQACKRMHIEELDDASVLAEKMAGRALELAGQTGSASRVIVFCDKRTDALKVKKQIEKQFRDVELLVGERRVWERSKLEEWLDEHGLLGQAKVPAERPTFLVATSAGEVGVDLNADHMVCDLVAYERMVQRLGRVNRRGEPGRQALVDVFSAFPAPLAANAKQATKDKRTSQVKMIEDCLAALRLLPAAEDDRKDACPSAFGKLKSDHPERVLTATTPQPLHPALTRPLLDAWSMTSLKRHEGRPEVAPWLRGWVDEDEPQTEVVWRRHLPCESRGYDESTIAPNTVAGFFRNAPLHASERLEARSSRVFGWLLKRATKLAALGSDHEPANGEVIVLLLDRAGDCIDSATLSDLRHLAAPAKSLAKQARAERDRQKRLWIERLPGAVLVVDARMGGLSGGMLEDTASNQVSSADFDEEWKAVAEDPEVAAFRPLVKFQIVKVDSGEEEEGLLRPELEKGWRHVQTYPTVFNQAGAAVHGLAILNWHDAAEDEDAKSYHSRPQLLHEHAQQAANHAARIARRLGLPDELSDALTLAARLHDDGKAAPRWQRAMNAPIDPQGRPFAKTRGGGNPRLLERYRHEFGSFLKAEQQDLPDNLRDLVLHLIAAHHGYARPLIGHEGCEEGPPSQMESKAGEAALRFARLQRQHGPWGLAWLEALVRAADQSASREWSRSELGGEYG